MADMTTAPANNLGNLRIPASVDSDAHPTGA